MIEPIIPALTNHELIQKAEAATRFLRVCGSKNGNDQANAIALLIQRFTLYENKLVHFSMSSNDVLKDTGVIK